MAPRRTDPSPPSLFIFVFHFLATGALLPNQYSTPATSLLTNYGVFAGLVFADTIELDKIFQGSCLSGDIKAVQPVPLPGVLPAGLALMGMGRALGLRRAKRRA